MQLAKFLDPRRVRDLLLRRDTSEAVLHPDAATIDVVKAAPPPSPLAPVDLTDPGQVSGVMDIAARIGGILLSSGTSNSDAKEQIHAVASAYGLHYCHVDITLNTITVFTIVGTSNRAPISVFRVVRKLTIDFSKLSEVDRLIRSIQAGATPPEVAEKALDELIAAPPPFGLKMSLFGWSLMAAAVAVLLGGNALVAAISAASALVIMGGSAWLDSKRLPVFFQNIYGGFVATMPAAVMYHFVISQGFQLAPGQIIASGIVVMLAGLTLVQALQDGITGAPVTAGARFFETMLLTGGIVAGVGIGLEVSAYLGISLPLYETSPTTGFSSATVKVISGAIASAGFTIACYSEWSSVFISSLASVTGSGIYYLVLLPQGLGPVVGIGIAATMIGLFGGLLARRFRVPPLITAVAGITPLLPGLAIYRGMYAIMHDQMVVGYSAMTLALAIATSLAAGVVLGEWVARKLRRPPMFRPYQAMQRLRSSPFKRPVA